MPGFAFQGGLPCIYRPVRLSVVSLGETRAASPSADAIHGVCGGVPLSRLGVATAPVSASANIFGMSSALCHGTTPTPRTALVTDGTAVTADGGGWVGELVARLSHTLRRQRAAHTGCHVHGEAARVCRETQDFVWPRWRVSSLPSDQGTGAHPATRTSLLVVRTAPDARSQKSQRPASRSSSFSPSSPCHHPRSIGRRTQQISLQAHRCAKPPFLTCGKAKGVMPFT